MVRKKFRYTINKKKYLSTDLLITRENAKKVEREMKKYGVLQHRVKKLKIGGFFGKPYMVISVLVPEKNFQKLTKVI